MSTKLPAASSAELLAASSVELHKAIEQALHASLEEALREKLAVGTEYRGEVARPSKYAARAMGWSHLDRRAGQPFTVWESHSYPGVLSVFYLTLGARVMLNDPDEELLKKVFSDLKEGYGDAVNTGGDMAEADLVDLDPKGVPAVEQLEQAAETAAVLVITDATGGARNTNGPIPITFRQLAGSPDGRWEQEKRSYEELWRAVAKSLGRKLAHFVVKAGGSPACYAVLT